MIACLRKPRSSHISVDSRKQEERRRDVVEKGKYLCLSYFGSVMTSFLVRKNLRLVSEFTEYTI